jgi:hypothetical protein
VDENGEPLVVYHGTSEDFTSFDPKEDGGQHDAIWFTDNPDIANFHALKWTTRTGANVMPLFLRLTKPLVTNANGKLRDTAFVNTAKQQERDGVIYQNANDAKAGNGTLFVAFDPTQIKSATANTGTYSNETGYIRYSFAPDTTPNTPSSTVDNRSSIDYPSLSGISSTAQTQVTPESQTFTPALHAIYYSTAPNDESDRGRAAQNRPGYPQVDFDRSGEGRRANEAQPGTAAENRRAASLEQFLRLVNWSHSQARFDVTRLSDERDRGGEHVIYNSTEGPQRLFKVTHAGQAGLTIVTHQNSQGEFNSAIGSATPSEYLERMVILNETFFSMIQLEGIIEGDQSSIVISQPKVEGSMPDQAEITAHLRDKLGFDRVDTLIWYRPNDGLVIGDTKRSNFIKTPDGQIVPIDITARFAAPEMAESWGYPPPPTSPLRQKLEAMRSTGRAQPLNAPVLTPDG